MSRYIRQGINGFTFKCGEKEELNKILTQILGDDKLQERLSQEAAKIYEKLSWGKILEMYKEIYNLS
jgi:glycosyltransferase involved in cell wall biosynthesis